MTNETTEKCYRAVQCIYCSEPIPLSTRLLELFVAESGNTTAESHGLSQVFTLRCEACSRESVYLKAEIDTHDGEPAQRGDVNQAGPKRYQKSFRKAAGQ